MSVPSERRPGERAPSRIRVFVIDDSALVRDILREGLETDGTIQVVGVAADAFEAGEKIPQLRPDVLTLDIEMPKMSGLEFLRRLMPQYPVPVVMVSALTERGAWQTLEAMSLGAVDFVTKPKADAPHGMERMLQELRERIRVAARAKVLAPRRERERDRDRDSSVRRVQAEPPADVAQRKLICLGASTGGSEAIMEVVTRLPAGGPGVLVVQHMPAGFTRLFAERLANRAALDAKEAADGDPVAPGRILVAPGGKQMRLVRRPAGGYHVFVRDEPPVNGHQPSVDVLFRSVAEMAPGRDVVAALLTGMGADGADAMKLLRDKGARCFAQDEATSVVWGMPQEAWKRGGAERLVPLWDMGHAITEALR